MHGTQEQLLRETEQHFRALVDDAPVMIWVTRPDGRCTYLSRSWYEFTGQTRDEALGFGWLEAVHPEDREHSHHVFATANANKQPFQVEYRLRRARGDYRWVIDSAQPRWGADGEFAGYVGSVIDISERRDAERALKESEERFRSLVQATTQITWTNDPDGKMRAPQPSWAAFTGQSSDELEGYGWSTRVHPEDREPTIREWERSVSLRRIFVWQHRVLRHDQEYRTCMVRAVPVTEADGRIREWVGAHTDITEQLALEAQTRLLADRLAAAQRATRAGIFDWDLTTDVVHWSDELYELLGLAPGEVAPSSEEWTNRLFPEDREVGWKAFNAAAGQKQAYFTTEVRMRLPNGRPRWLRISNQLSFDDVGQVVRLVGSAIDIQELKEIGERERIAREHAERSVRFSDMFVGVLGHDLRNPLSAIAMAAKVLELRADKETISKPVARIIASAARMEGMIDQLLDFTRIRVGHGIPLARSSVNLAEVMQAIIDELEPVQKRELQLKVVGDARGTWDRDRLAQMLSNLAANACQHGSPQVPVEVAIDGLAETLVRVEVKNGGVIAPERLPLLFEPLQSSEKHARRDGASGLGLGLYITQQIAIAHGGVIRVESDAAAGTRFIVDLPRQPHEPSQAP